MNFTQSIFYIALFALALLLASCSTTQSPAAPSATPSPTFDATVDVMFTGKPGTIMNGVKIFSRVTDALDDAPDNATKLYSIFIKNGR